MGKLKPIGSEKLEGQDKINRIIQLSRYNENRPTNLNETSNIEYSIDLPDNKKYMIVKERQGYIIKQGLSESTADYIEPIKNRKYYSSYSQALKRMNLLAKELNRLHENDMGVSLFGEQQKYVLKNPNPPAEQSSAPPSEPPAVPSPELPPSPLGDESGVPPSPEMGGDEGMGMDDVDTSNQNMDDDVVSFKMIQKLTGKLTQKIRQFEDKEGMTSENIKYVVNMVLSSLTLNNLSPEDKEDIMSKFEDSDEFGGEMPDEMSGDEFSGDDMGGEVAGGEMTPDQDMGNVSPDYVGESKINKILSKYFEVSKSELIENRRRDKNRLLNEQRIFNKKMESVKELSESYKQFNSSKKFLSENSKYNVVGKTNTNCIVFEHNGRKFKVNPDGFII